MDNIAMNVLLLSTQLIDPQFIKKILNVATVYITVYEHQSVMSTTKKAYFSKCLSEYMIKHKVSVIHNLHKLLNHEYHYFDLLHKDVEALLHKLTTAKRTFVKHYNPMFLLSHAHREEWVNKHKTFTFSVFYKYHRELLKIFPHPIGGKWSYDDDNQNKLPKLEYDKLPSVKEISFPTNRQSSLSWLKNFIKHRLSHFGPYQDTITDKNLIMYHAGISPMLNMGMILPNEVVKLIPNASRWTVKTRSSYEGFLRQLFWREYMALIYTADFKLKNIFGSNNRLSNTWYQIKDKYTGISLLDDKIRQTIQYGYLHHIERLMLVGNFLLLASIKPIDVYDWFMINFVDAHDWVMVGNVYHMLLYSSGSVVTKRPYIASSTYLKKMIRITNTPDSANMSSLSDADCELWDKYYAAFINKNKAIIAHTYLSSGHLKRARLLSKK